MTPGILLGAVLTLAPQADVSTPQAALARIREERAAGRLPASEEVVVEVASGTSLIDRTLQMGPVDSHIRFRGPAAGEGVFSGGRDLGTFVAGTDGIWRVKVPADVRPEQLWVGGRRAQRAVSPNGDGAYYHIRQNAFEEDDGTGKVADLAGRAFYADEPNVFAPLAGLSEKDLHDVFVHAYFAWDTEWMRLKRVDPARNFAVLTATTKRDFFRWKSWLLRFKLENFRAALDAPGEWWFDRTKGEILYLPRPDDDVASARAVVPAVDRWLAIEGGETNPVRNVTFERLTFATAGHVMPEMLFVGQSAFKVGGTIETRHVRGVAFRSCRFRATSRLAICLGPGSRESSVTGCVFDDLGSGGVRIGRPYLMKPQPRETLAGVVTVADNVFAHGGRLFTEGTAVDIDNAVDCRIVHNDIVDFYYTGVHSDQSGATDAPRNYIGFNRIRGLGRGVMCDMGGIYLTGPERGSVVEGNVIHGVWSYSYTGAGGTGLYADEKCTGAHFISNLVYRTKTSPVNQNYGWDNVFANNILALTTPVRPLLVRCRQEKGLGMAVSNNVFYWRGSSRAVMCAPRPGRRPTDDLVFASNLYWSPDGIATNAFNGGSWEAWRADGNDVGSAIGDPGFVCPSKGDFTMRNPAVAQAVGFRPWNYADAGARPPALRAWAEAIPDPTAVEIAEPKRYAAPSDFSTGFEFLRPGSPLAAGAIEVSGVGRTAVVAAADDAKTGRNCLKVTDSAATPGIYPYLETTLPRASRSVSLSFAIKYGPDANFIHEWREYAVKGRNGKYAVGLMLMVRNGKMTLRAAVPDGKGGVRRQETRIAAARPDVWQVCRFDLTVDGRTAPSLTFALTTSDGKTETIGSLCADDGLHVPEWIGFLFDGDRDNVYRLDDFEYHVK